MKKFNERMCDRAYDIRCTDPNYEKQLAERNGVKMTQNDIDFYEDNCKPHGTYTYYCSSSIPRDWVRQVQRKQQREESERKKSVSMEEENTHQEHVNMMEMRNSLMEIESEDLDQTRTKTYGTHVEDEVLRRPSPTRNTNTVTGSEDSRSEFPKVKIRTGRKRLSEPVKRCLVQCLSKYKVTVEDLTGIAVDIGNMIFGQSWAKEARGGEDDTDGLSDSESDDIADGDDELRYGSGNV